MAGTDKCHTCFIGKMILRFGNFTGQIRIDTFVYGRLKKSLRTAAAPGNTFDFTFKIADNGRLATEYRLNAFRLLRQCLRSFQTACIQQVLLAELFFEHPIEFLGQLCVIA